MTELAYTLIPDVNELIDAIPTDSIVSRTFYKGADHRAILFGFDAGQALSEHTSSQAAVIQIVRGEATVTVGNDKHHITEGAWLHLSPRVAHSIYAKTPLLMLLSMFNYHTDEGTSS